MNEEAIKKLPFSILAEQALLGSVLIDPAALVQISDTVNASDFYISEHRAIYSAMLHLSGASRDIDLVTLLDTLEKEKVYTRRDDAESYIRTLTDSVPNALNIRDYARIVIEKSLMRQLIEACSSITEKAYSDQEKVNDVLDYAAGLISNISMGRDTRNFKDLKTLLAKVYRDLSELQQNPGSFEGTKTGYSGLDRMLAGIGQTDFVLIGARPGMGKTSFALNIATNVALQTGKKVAIFSLEMSDEQLATRILSSTAMVDSYALRTGNISQSDWSKLAAAVDKLSPARILIDDTSDISVSAMKAKLRREGNIGMVVIDYLQLMHGEKHSDNRVLEVAEITRGLKLLAKDLKVPVLCCSQLSRGTEARTSKRPMLSDLRESGSIEQDADSVIFIYRDEYYDEKKNSEPITEEAPVVEIIIAKNRHGSTGTVNMHWLGKYTTFYSAENDHGDEDAPPEYASRTGDIPVPSTPIPQPPVPDAPPPETSSGMPPF
ncbi:MAG: replicative DNA helicase [Clostridia bacterium]|nr:replicative DNA helicase [Clostridia bacterium]